VCVGGGEGGCEGGDVRVGAGGEGECEGGAVEENGWMGGWIGSRQ